MADQPLSERGIRRSAVYSYLRPLFAGRRVLELGCGAGEGSAQLARLGAQSVTGAGEAGEIARARTSHRESGLSFINLNPAALEAAGPFDVVLVPEAGALLQGRGGLKLDAAKRLLAPQGHLICVVPNGDRDGGAGVAYFDVIDRLSPHFPKVRMFGQTPFAAFGIAEFDETAAEMRIEADPALAETDEPTHYIAVAGEDAEVSLGYALVQVPPASLVAVPEAKPVAPSAPPAKPADGTIAELRQKLADAQGQAEGLLRVSRAQTEEIEELRARVRRTAESKAELDEEVRRLRRALIEADESVVQLTRKTTEDMTALAQRLTTGLRDAEKVPGPELSQELRRRDAALAERESALSERDDRIAALEAARQEALWRADAAEDEAARLKTEVTKLRQAPPPPPPVEGPSREELLGMLRSREQALEEFQRAATAHLDEVARLRDALNEQSSLVVELEEDLGKAEKQLAECQQEGTRLRQSVAEVEQADRERRSRLAELEGQMMRLQRTQAEAERKAQTEGAAQSAQAGEVKALRDELTSRQAEVEELRSQIAEAERRLADSLHLRDETERARKLIAGRLAELEEKARLADQAAAHLAELRAEAPDPEEVYERLADLQAQYDATVLAAARVPALEAALAAAQAQVAELQRRGEQAGR